MTQIRRLFILNRYMPSTDWSEPKQPAGGGAWLRKAGLRMTRPVIVGLLAASVLASGSSEEVSIAARWPFGDESRANANTSLELLRAFESAENSVYSLGEGDKITLEVWGHPELSGAHVVGPDGYITLPIAGPVKLSGLSREEAHEGIAGTLGRYYLSLAITLRIDEYTSNHVYVLGRVSQPGMVSFDTQPTLLEAITRAGGLSVGEVGAEHATLTRCAVFRGRDQVVWVDLQALLRGGNLALNLRLRRDDVIYIPDARDQLVYVLGQVEKPGAIRLTPEMNFLDALALAGGPSKDAAVNKMRIVRPDAGAAMSVPLKQLLASQPGLNVTLQEGDIIYVPKRGIARFGYIFEKLNPVSSLLIFSTAMSQ